jgi:hypothetical protein
MNESIYKRLIDMIRSYHKESKTISKFYIGWECFNNVGKYINFIDLNKKVRRENNLWQK